MINDQRVVGCCSILVGVWLGHLVREQAVTLRFTVLGFELARITLDIEHHDLPSVTTAVERSVKAVSRAWIKRMVTS